MITFPNSHRLYLLVLHADFLLQAGIHTFAWLLTDVLSFCSPTPMHLSDLFYGFCLIAQKFNFPASSGYIYCRSYAVRNKAIKATPSIGVSFQPAFPQTSVQATQKKKQNVSAFFFSRVYLLCVYLRCLTPIFFPRFLSVRDKKLHK